VQLRENYRCTRRLIVRITNVLTEHRDALCNAWRSIHGNV
jgi:hypothetical protein